MFPRAAELRTPSTQPHTGAASRPVAHGQVQESGAFQPGRKLAVKQSSASPQTAMLGGVSLQVAFVLEVRDGQQSIAGSEEGLSCPCGQARLGKRSRPVLCHYCE